MAIFGSQTPHESSVSGKVKCTPLQGTDYAKRCASDPPSPNYRNLDQWLRENVQPEVTGETEDVQVVRTFYTYRLTPKGGINIWYADVEFGFYEALPKRVADLNATHVVIEFPRKSGINPTVEFYVEIGDPKTGKRRPIHMHELIEKVIHDDDEWKDGLPDILLHWELIFPKGESWGIMRVVGLADSPGPSRQGEWTIPIIGGVPGA